MSNESPERTSQEGVLLGSNVAWKYDDSWYLGVVVKYRGGVTVTIESGRFSLLASRVKPVKELHNIPPGEHLVTYDDGDTERTFNCFCRRLPSNENHVRHSNLPAAQHLLARRNKLRNHAGRATQVQRRSRVGGGSRKNSLISNI